VGDADFDQNVNIDGALGVTGLSTLGSILVGTAILGDTQESGKLQFSSNGRPQYRRLAASDANATVSINDYDIVFLEGAILSTNRVWTVDSVAAENGMVMELSRANDGSGNSITVLRSSDGATLGILTATWGSIRIVFSNGHWRLLSRNID
jgi:hypothetical protein